MTPALDRVCGIAQPAPKHHRRALLAAFAIRRCITSRPVKCCPVPVRGATHSTTSAAVSGPSCSPHRHFSGAATSSRCQTELRSRCLVLWRRVRQGAPRPRFSFQRHTRSSNIAAFCCAARARLRAAMVIPVILVNSSDLVVTIMPIPAVTTSRINIPEYRARGLRPMHPAAAALPRAIDTLPTFLQHARSRTANGAVSPKPARFGLDRRTQRQWICLNGNTLTQLVGPDDGAGSAASLALTPSRFRRRRMSRITPGTSRRVPKSPPLLPTATGGLLHAFRQATNRDCGIFNPPDRPLGDQTPAFTAAAICTNAKTSAISRDFCAAAPYHIRAGTGVALERRAPENSRCWYRVCEWQAQSSH
jgi:hypothetical protein